MSPWHRSGEVNKFPLSTGRLAGFSARHPWWVVGVWLAFLIGAVVAFPGLSHALTANEMQFLNNPDSVKAEKLLDAVRSHWGVENSLHWVLDVVFDEDHSRVRKDHAPQNLAVIRQIAVNLLMQEKTAKGGIQAKRLQAAWDEAYLLKVLSV